MSVDSKSITIWDFCPWNKWEMLHDNARDVDDNYFNYDGRYEKDVTTGKAYLYQHSGTLRAKHAGLLILSVTWHVYQAISRLFKVLTFYSFWGDSTKTYPLLGRLGFMGKDILKLALTPGLVLALEIAALYGLFFPKEGRKEYASIERFAHIKLGISGKDLFGRFVPYCAPCYQPFFGMS